MKKTLIAIALAAMMAPAWGAEVVSSNIVGYNKIQLNAGLNMLSSQFVVVGSDNIPLDLTDATNLTGQPSFNDSGDAQTTLRFWTGGGYTYYGWAGNLTGENPDMAEEIADELGVDPATLNNHWLDGDYAVVDDPMENGEGFWLYAKTGGTLTIAGQVLDTDTETRDLVAGLNMVASPWPMNVSLTKISVTGQPSFNESGDAQTTLRVWTGGGYTYYAWAGNLTGENPDMAEEIADELGVDPTTLNNHWLNGDYEIADDEIEIGTSFWIYAKNSGTITFSK